MSRSDERNFIGMRSQKRHFPPLSEESLYKTGHGQKQRHDIDHNLGQDDQE